MSVFDKNTRRVLSYDVLRQQKTGVMSKGGLCPGGLNRLTSHRLRRITSSPSQTLRRRLLRTTDDGRRRECSARRLQPFVAALFSHFATRIRLTAL